MSQASARLLLIAACGLAGCLVQAASLPDTKALQALAQKVNQRQEMSVDEVVAAYNQYWHLYQRQSELAGTGQGGQADGDYNKITEILRASGVGELAQTLFAPFEGGKPKAELSPKRRESVRTAIAQLVSQY